MSSIGSDGEELAYTQYAYMHCPECQGSGSFESGKTCDECDGEGRFPVDEFVRRWPEREQETWGIYAGERAVPINDPGIVNDGFRPRRKRPKGWHDKAIRSGQIRDPNDPDPDEGKDYSAAEVVNPPVATMESEE